MNCPKDGYTLEFISGTFGTGVFAPDGGQETRYQEGWQCPKCETIYDESDVSDGDGIYDPDPHDAAYRSELYQDDAI